MKLINKIKKKVRQSSKFLIYYMAIGSMLLNLATPFLISYSYVVYAEDSASSTSNPSESSSSSDNGDKPDESSNSESSASEESSSNDSAVSEESSSSSEEETSDQTQTAEEPQSSDTNVNEGTTETAETFKQDAVVETTQTTETAGTGDTTGTASTAETITPSDPLQEVLGTQIEDTIITGSAETAGQPSEQPSSEASDTQETPSQEDSDTSNSSDQNSQTNGTVPTEDSAQTTEPAQPEGLSQTTGTTAGSEPQGEIDPLAATDYRGEAEIITGTGEEIQIIEQECMPEGQNIVSSTQEDWNYDEANGYAETKNNVQLGVKYTFPGDKDVSVTFTCLPKNDSDKSLLKIQKVKVSDLKLPEEFKTDAEYAYDITTDMDSGSFKYSVALPKPEGKEVGVSYIEKSLDEATSQEVKSEEVFSIDATQIQQQEQSKEVKVEDLDHFSIYITTYADIGLTVTETVYLQGDVVYIQATGLNTGKYYRADILKGTTYKYNVVSCTTGVGSFPGSYTLSLTETIGTDWKVDLTQYNNLTDCNARTSIKDTKSAIFQIKNTTPAPSSNPGLPNACGLDIAIVIDVSGSISTTELNQMKSAFTSFVDALSTTPTQYSVTKFDTTATVLQSFTADSSVVKTKINSASGGGYTNWEDAIYKSTGTFGGRPDKPDLIIFASDGNPNTVIGGAGGAAGETTALNAAVVKANSAKASGIRILTIGIGDQLSIENLKAISGNKVNTGDVTTSDVITTDFSGLAAQLATFAKQTCGGKISVFKYVDNEQKSDGQTWHFKIDGSVSLDAGSDGTIVSDKLSEGTHSIKEVSIPEGYTFDRATCSNGTFDPANNGVKDISITDGTNVSCSFYNTTNKGSITIVKDTVPDDPQDFSFTASGGLSSGFTLDDDGGTDATYSNSLTFSNVSAGTYTVTENSQSGFILTDLVCSDPTGNTTVDLSTRSATINLGTNENITCTFTNTKQSPALSIDKSATPSTYSKVGDIISYSYKVKNTGNVTLFNISVVDDKATAKCPDTSLGLAPLAEITCTASYTITQADLDSGSVTNSAYATDGVTKSNTDKETVNSVAAKIIIEKQTTPDGDEKLFEFDPSWSTNNFNLSDGKQLESDWLAPGNYTVKEIVPDGWDLTDITCNDKNSGKGAAAGDTAEIKLEGNELVKCTFTNTKKATIIVYKFNDLNGNGKKDDGEPLLPGWSIVLDEKTGSVGYTQATDENGQTIFVIAPTDYKLYELMQRGWTQTAISCSNEEEPEPGAGIGVCHWNEGADKWNALSIEVTNPGHIGKHEKDFEYKGPAEWLGGKDGKLGDQWCEDNFPGLLEPAVPALVATLGVVTDDYYPLTVEPGSTTECYIGNVQLSDVHGFKWNDYNGDGIKDENESLLGDWKIFIDENGNQKLDSGEENTLTANNGPDTGYYWFTGLLPGTYSICEELQNGWDQTYPGTICHTVVLPYEKTLESTFVQNAVFAPLYNFGNFQKGGVTGCKYNDINASGIRSGKETDEGITEPQLSGWTIRLYDSEWKKVSEYVTDPYFHFDNIMSKGTYYLCEVMKTGWVQTEPASSSAHGYTSVLNLSGDSSEGKYCKQVNVLYSGFYGSHYYGFGNVQVNPVLHITKENDTGGHVKSIGDHVKYTLRVWVMDSDVYDVEVHDLLPKGFKYIHGSWKAYDYNNNEITVDEPNYASPGTWKIGHLVPDQPVILVYDAEIQNSVDAGIYKDLAWTHGDDVLDRYVLGLAENTIQGTGKVSTNFVGTKVEVALDVNPEQAKASTKVDKKVEEVLGASSVRLPATGISPAAILAVISGVVIGGLLLISGGIAKLMKKRKIVASIIAVLMFGILSSNLARADSSLFVRLEDPGTPQIGEFKLTFVVMDLEPASGRDIYYECYNNTPSDSVYKVFETGKITTLGGDTANCNVNGDVLDDDGTYNFYVKAWVGEEDPAYSEKVFANYDGTGPGKPKYIEKDKKSDCKNEITLKTADDGGQTSYVEVYRSTHEEFNVGDANRIEIISLGSNTKYSFDDEFSGGDCGKKYYYAVRAFDSSGNASKVRSEEIIETEKETIQGETTEEVIQAAIPGVGGGQVLGTGESTEGAQVVLEGQGAGSGEQSGNVLGEETTGVSGSEQGGILGAVKNASGKWWFWLGGLGLAIIIVNAIRKKKSGR